MKHKVKITLTIMLILASALLWAMRPQPAQAMRRESFEPIQGEIIEGRAIFVTRYDKRCNSWIEVLEV